MRNLVLGCVAIAALALVACGPSSSEVKGARTARYKGDKLEIFRAARAAVEAKFKLEAADENTLGFKTIGTWYDPEGGIAMDNASASSTTRTMVPDKSLNIQYVVGLKPDGDTWIVEVKPIINRYHAGSPQPEPLQEGDISLPGWVGGKTDSVALDVHNALTKWEVKSVPGQVPAGNTPPPPPPAGSGDTSSAAPAAPPAS